MKEFEKWFSRNKKTWPYSPHDDQDCEPAWRAALEWALTQKIQFTEEMLIDEVAIRKELLSQQSNNQS